MCGRSSCSILLRETRLSSRLSVLRCLDVLSIAPRNHWRIDHAKVTVRAGGAGPAILHCSSWLLSTVHRVCLSISVMHCAAIAMLLVGLSGFFEPRLGAQSAA